MNTPISRRELLRLAAAMGGTAFLGGCGATPMPPAAPTVASAPVAGAEPVTLSWLEWWADDWGWDTLNWLVEGFQAQNPNVKIDITDVSYDEMLMKLQTAALAGQGWDVFGTEAEAWIIQWEQYGMVEDLTPWLEKAGPGFTDRLTDMTTVYWKGKPYMLYLYLIPFQLAYEASKLKAMDIEPPQNWDDFYNACVKFREKGEYGYGMSLRPDSDQFTGKMWGYRFVQAGGQIVDRDGQVRFHEEPGIIATEWWRKFYQDGLAMPGSETEDKMTTTENLATGKIAMTIDGPFIRSQCKQINPDSDIWWCPAWRAETGGYHWGGSGIAMWAKGKHKEESWKFLEYLFQDDIALQLAQKTSIPFAVKTVFQQDWLKDDPIMHALPAIQNQDPEHSWSFPPFPEQGTLFMALSTTIVDCVKGDKTDIPGALKEAADIWQKTLDEAWAASSS